MLSFLQFKASKRFVSSEVCLSCKKSLLTHEISFKQKTIGTRNNKIKSMKNNLHNEIFSWQYKTFSV